MIIRMVCAFVILLAAVSAQADAVPAPRDVPLEEEVGVQRVWVEPAGDASGKRATISVQADGEVQAAEQIVFDCMISSIDRLERGVVRLEIHNDEDRVLHEGEMRLDLNKGGTPCRFTWVPDNLPLGVFVARFELFHYPEGSLAVRELTVRKLAEMPLQRAIDEAAEKVHSLREHLDTIAKEGYDPAYARVRLTVAEEFVPVARRVFAQGDWRRAEALAQYVGRTVDSVRSELAFGGFASKLTLPADVVEPGAFEAGHGGFHAQGRPAFFVGAVVEDDDDIRAVARHGLNLALLEVSADRPVEPGSVQKDVLDRAFDAASSCGISIIVRLVHLIPEMPVSEVSVPDLQACVDARLQAVAAAMSGRPNLHSVCLACEPEYRFGGEALRGEFVNHMKTEFSDLYDLNRIWRARLGAFDEILLPWPSAAEPNAHRPNYLSGAAYQYDWQTLHSRASARFSAWLLARGHDLFPGTPLFIAESGRLFEEHDPVLGVGREVLNADMDVNGCISRRTDPRGVFATSYPYPGITYSLLRSGNPELPTVDGGLRLAVSSHPYADAYGYTRTMLWQAATLGVGAAAVYVEEQDEAGTLQADRTFFDRPDCLEAAATACLDLNRLGNIVAAIQQAPADVAIIWSDASRIFDGGDPYLKTLRNAYEGCSFFGRNVRFITEQQCRSGVLKEVRVLVIPDTPSASDDVFEAVKEYIENGGIVIRRERPMFCDARGAARQDVILPTDQTILVRGKDEPSQYLHAMDAAVDTGRLEPCPRPINEFGYPLDGVVSRTASLEGKEYLYLVNLRKEAVRVSLSSPWCSGWDLIQDREALFPYMLEPLAPMLVRLDPPEVLEDEPTEEVTTEGIPTAEVTPVVPPSDEKATR